MHGAKVKIVENFLDKPNNRNFWKKTINRTIISMFPKVPYMGKPLKKFSNAKDPQTMEIFGDHKSWEQTYFLPLIRN